MKQDLLWHIGDHSRLIICYWYPNTVAIFNTTNDEILCQISGQILGLSDDERHVVIEQLDRSISVWSLLSGKQAEITDQLIATFDQSQTLLVHLKRSELVLEDAFTGETIERLSPPKVNTYDSFDLITFRFPGQRFLFQSTFVDDGWGESHRLWCYDITARKWLFNDFYSINDKPCISVSS
ncbi:MAG: hypothetical protein AAFQ07_13155, partial [Chloroflexota bacterium]